MVHRGVAQVAVALATLVVVVVGISFVILSVALATGGDQAISDNWVGMQAGLSLVAGLVLSLVAMVLAVVARVRHDRRRMLWLPLAVFPALLLLVVVAEVVAVE